MTDFKPTFYTKVTPMIFLATFLIMLLSVAPLVAQTPAPKQTGTIALTGATIHTLSGSSIENGTIIFEDGIITAVGASIDVPAGARVENISGKHVYPGLIDAWSHIGITEIGAVDMSNDVNEQGPVNPNARADRAFHPESRHIGVARSAGIVVAITSPGGGLVSGQSAAMMLEGWTWQEMTLKAGTGMMVNWPNPNNARTYGTQLETLRETFSNARAYQTAQDAMEAGKGDFHNVDSRWEAMIPVFNGEMPVVVSANDVRQIQDAITWSKEEGIRLVILGGRDSHLVTEHLISNDIPVLVTSVQSAPSRWWEPYYAWYELPLKLHEAGVTFAIVGSSSAANANRFPFEAGTAAAYGLPAEEALKSVSLYAAQIMGIDDRIGSIEVGKDASFIITDGNPIEYRTRVEQVYIQGRKSDMNDAHSRAYERYSEKLNQRQ